MSILFLHFNCHAQKVEWLDFPQPHINSYTAGLQIIPEQNGHVLFNVGINDTPVIFHGKTVLYKSSIDQDDHSLFLTYDTSGLFIMYNTLSERGLATEKYQLLLGPKKNGNYYFCGLNDVKGNLMLSELNGQRNIVWQKMLDSLNTSNVDNYYKVWGTAMDDSENIYFIYGGVDTINILSHKFYPEYSDSTALIGIIKADSAGNMLWHKPLLTSNTPGLAVYNATGPNYPFNLKLFIDKQGHIHFAGSSTIGFSMGGRHYKPIFKSGLFTGELNNNGAMLRDSFYNGDFREARLAFEDDQAFPSCLDDSGNLYVMVDIKGNTRFGKIVLTGSNNYSSALIKFDSGGNAIWGKVITHSTASPHINPEDTAFYATIKTDHKGNVYAGGMFDGAIVVGKDTEYASPTRLTSTSAIYIIKYNSSGLLLGTKILQYNRKDGIYPYAWLNDMIPDDSGNLYFTGEFKDSVQMDTFHLYGSHWIWSGNLIAEGLAFFNGKINFGVIDFPDSMGISHICGQPYNFRLYYQTTPDSIAWNFGDGTKSRQFQLSHIFAAPGNYIVKATAYLQGHAKVLVDTVHYLNQSTLFLPHDTILCNGINLNLKVNVPGATNYLWNDGDTDRIRSLSKAGLYKLTISADGCSLSDSFNLSYDNRSFSLGADTTICQNIPIKLSGPAWSGAKYLWNTGDTTIYKNIISGGLYSLDVYDGICHFSNTIKVKYESFPEHVLPADTTLCMKNSFRINLSDFPGSITWQPVPSNGDVSNYVISKSGLYIVSLQNECGARTWSTIVKDSNCDCYITTPDAFSPNDDHINEVFMPVLSCQPESYSFQIYNRWGELIFQSNDINHGWDGTNVKYGGNGIYKSPHCPPGVYIYKIMYKFQHGTEQEKMGTVEIM